MPSKPRQKKSDHPQKHPIRIVPLHRPEAVAAPAAAAPHLTYRNGPLLTAVQVFTVFWGSAWDQASNSSLMTQINQFFDYILTSQLMDQLGEYSVPGQAIGHGSRIGTKVLTSPAPGTSVQDSAIQQLIQQEIDAGTLPAANANTLYFVFLPNGVTVVQGNSSSCQAFCGYHDSFGQNLYYAVMPYPGCSGCTGGSAVFDALPPLLPTNYAKRSPTLSPDKAGMTIITERSAISAPGKHARWAVTPFSSNGPIGRAPVYRS